MELRRSSFMPSLPFESSNPSATATAATPPVPTPQPENVNKNRKRTTQPGSGLGTAVPSIDLPFPVHANFTAVELLTFFPLSMRCADVIYRLITNGGTRKTIWTIVNSQRDLVKELSQNTCGNWIYKAMEKAGYSGWTIKVHDRFHEQKKATWNESNLDVGGFKTPGQINGKPEPSANIPFKSLATDVRHMPTGEDALDLTRMVRYCVQNPEESWLYPREYETLLSRLGGSAEVQKVHTDKAAFRRWEGYLPPPPRLARPDLPPEEHEAPQKKVVRRDSPRIYSWESPSEPAISGQSPPSQATLDFYYWDPDKEETPLPPPEPPKRGRLKGARNKAVKSRAQAVAEPVVPEEVAGPEQYIRQPAEYVPPPTDTTTKPTHEEIELAFAKERSEGKDDTQSPYAFGGPRVSPPYRMLHKIRQPHPADKSGWAENLRWHFEQSACFRFSFRADEWNESPEHMELIVEARKRQFWVSDELIELVMREKDREDAEAALEIGTGR